MDKYTNSVLFQLFTGGPQTRNEIMKALKMRQNSLVKVCDQLITSGELTVSDPERKRNVLLDFATDHFCTAGLDHQIDEARIVLLDGRGTQIDSAVAPLPVNGGRLDALLDFVSGFFCRHSACHITALGMADVGIVDTAAGLGLYSAHVRDWKDVPLESSFSNRFHLHFSLLDRLDANCIANLKNAGQGDCMYVWCGDGIGMTMLRKGEFFGRGAKFAGQLGHTIAQRGGKLCSCGNRGCLETIASIRSIREQIALVSGKRDISTEELLREAVKSNRLYATTLREAGEAVGIALANAVTLTGISRVMVQGPLCREDSPFCMGMEDAMRKNILYPLCENLDFAVEPMKQDAAALGAALFARREFFESLPRKTDE